LRQLRYVIIVV